VTATAAKAGPSESDIQCLFRSRARMQCPAVRIIAIPNGSKRGQRAMNQARREGAAWGFCDVMCLAPGARAAFIEFKSATGKLSDNQVEWIDRLRDMGFPATVARDPDDALAFLRSAGFPFECAA
jgi:hypothetical protein